MRHLAPAIAVLLAAAAPAFAGDAQPLPVQPGAIAPAPAEPAATDVAALRQSVSRLIGMRLKSMIDRAVTEGDLDRTAILAGLQEAVAGTAVEPDMAAQQQLFQAWDVQLQARQAKLAADQVSDNQVFLAENAKKPGVTATASGLQYQVVKKGPDGGKQPTAASQVRVHYTGTKRDGTVFDSSVQRGEPAEFPLNGVIPGWTEGLQLMREGDTFRFTIPSDLAYGAGGPPGIGANQVLIFDIELLKVLD